MERATLTKVEQIVKTTLFKMQEAAGKLDIEAAKTEPENGDYGVIEFEGTPNQAPYIVVDADAFDHQRSEVCTFSETRTTLNGCRAGLLVVTPGARDKQRDRETENMDT